MWEIGPFTRLPGAVIEPTDALWWAAKDVFNPGAVVHDGQVCLLVRGEDNIGRFAGTSRVGLATSTDGASFTVEPEPVFGPDDDFAEYEAEGGCEDPRVIEAPGGTFVCTYTGFAGKRAILMVATSPDLRTWTKHGPAFAGTPYAPHSAKSGAVVTEVVDGRLVAAKVNDKYWMYWGEGSAYAATSDDLIAWTPVDYDATGDHTLAFVDGHWSVTRDAGTRALTPLLRPRAHRFDSGLVEPGPPAVKTEEGIVLIYNGANGYANNDPTLPIRAYCPGQALFDPLDPTAPVARSSQPFLRPDVEGEKTGQVDNVCFAEGLVLFNGEWRLYFGMADSRIGCATAPFKL